MDPALSTRLGTVLTRKTLGYPFFVLRYLKLLYDSRDLYFDPQRGLWECNIDKVATMELTINAAELVVAEFRRVDPEVRNGSHITRESDCARCSAPCWSPRAAVASFPSTCLLR